MAIEFVPQGIAGIMTLYVTTDKNVGKLLETINILFLLYLARYEVV
jgi:hypothetical protein